MPDKNVAGQIYRVEIKIKQLIIIDSKTTAALCPAQLVIGVAATGATPRLKSVFVYERHGVAKRKGQRREPAADDVRFVSERIGWLPFAASSGSAFMVLEGTGI